MKKIFLLFALLTLSAGLWARNISNNQIWYTSSDGDIVEPKHTDQFNVAISTNTYQDGKGVITFDGELEWIVNLCFNGCSNLRTVYVNWTEKSQIPVVCVSSEIPDYPFVHEFAFGEIAKQDDFHSGRKYAALCVPAGTENLYYKSSYWSTFGTIHENLTNLKPAAIAAIETAKQGVTNAHIFAIAEDAIEAINAATSSLQIEGIRTQTLADIEHAENILTDLPTDPEGTADTVVEVTKGDKTIKLYNPEKVEFKKK